MNVYVEFALAMCAIVLLAFAATAYLAVVFNRRAKADLVTALAPLAERIGGAVDLDEATVSGQYAGHLVAGRMANATGGPGRVFQTELMDPAGGVAWDWIASPARAPEPSPAVTFTCSDAGLRDRLGTATAWQDALAAALTPHHDRYRLDYDPVAGRLRLTVPMRTRRDIPAADAFARQFDALVALGPANRRAQGAPDADWIGGRRGEGATVEAG